MARPPNPTPTQELALHEALVAVRTRLQTLDSDEKIAALGIAEATEGLRIWDKELRHLYENLLGSTTKPKDGTAALERKVKGYASVLEKSLKLAGKNGSVSQVHKEHNGTVAVAKGLLAAAQGVSTKTVGAAATDLKDSLGQLTNELSRIADSGHPLFDPETVKLGMKVWACLDNAYDALGMCLRKAAIAYDPIFANRPSTKTPLRLIFKAHPDAPASPGKPAKGKKGKGDKPQTPESVPPVSPPDGSGTPAASAKR